MLLAKNRKAFHDNALVDKYVAGIKLAGYEVKSVREGNVNFDGSYVQILSGVPYVVNLYIGRFSKQSQPYNENTARNSRVLLLNKREIAKIVRELDEKGKTAVPLALVLSHNLIKLELAVVKGLKKFEKKNVEKERQQKRDMEIEAKMLG
jgi:SsrA-binding protein